ncbi:unnamed protein product, partial [Rotaria socialis]
FFDLGSSSTIVELNVNLRTTDNWLRLLDGRFSQLKSISVVIDLIDTPSLNVDNTVEILLLKLSYLPMPTPAEEYDHVILPLLRQMSNLETLILNLKVENRPEFIDGAHLY